MNTDFVMTDSERQAYRYSHAPLTLRLGAMKKSWSHDSLASCARGAKACVCAPTTHPGSFRCKYHRHASNHATGAAAAQAPPADAAKHQESEGCSSTDQDRSS